MIRFIYISLQLQSIITALNQWLSMTRSIPYWTTSVFSSAVTDLDLIYESVTSSASVVLWLTLHSWTLEFLRIHPTEFTNELSFITRGEPKRGHHLELFLCYFVLIRCYETYLATCYPATYVLRNLLNVFTVPLSSNGDIRRNIAIKVAA
jgi:hypothetical protein